MKKFVLTLATILILTTSNFAQVAINETGATPNASAILDISSSDKGILIPRMSTTDRTTNITPVEGLLVYDTTTDSFWYYDATQSAWVEINSGTAVSEIDDLSDAKTDFSSLFLGSGAGIVDDGNNSNTAIGINCLNANTSGFQNTANGYKSLYSNTSGFRNTAIGDNALYSNISGGNNTGIGVAALYNLTTANGNSALGLFALEHLTDGEYNVAIGAMAMDACISGDYNVSIGTQSSFYNQNGNNNTTIGYQAGSGGSNHTKSGCVMIGCQAGYFEQNSNKLYIDNSSTSLPLIGGDFSTNQVDINGTIKITGGTPGNGKVLTADADGLATWETPTTYASQLNDLSDAIWDGASIFIGDQVGTTDDGNNYNTALGDEAFKANTSGQRNTAVGYKSLIASNGGSNTAIGFYALGANTSGNYNTAIGSSAMYNNQTGSNNTALGYEAGEGSTGNSITGCVFLGYQAGKANTNDNKLFIDNSSTTSPLIGGDFNADELYFNADVGIGTESPNELLEVAGTTTSSGRMIISDGGGSSREVLLFVSPDDTHDYARIDAYDYGSSTGKTLRINATGDGDVMFGGNIVTESHKSANIGASGKAWDNVYADDFVNEGAAAFANVNVTKQLISFPPKEKKAGAFDEFTDKGLKELDPASLPKELTEDNALLIDEMTTYNYKANYEQQVQIEQQKQQIETLKTENEELKTRLDRLEKMISNR